MKFIFIKRESTIKSILQRGSSVPPCAFWHLSFAFSSQQLLWHYRLLTSGKTGNWIIQKLVWGWRLGRRLIPAEKGTTYSRIGLPICTGKSKILMRHWKKHMIDGSALTTNCGGHFKSARIRYRETMLVFFAIFKIQNWYHSRSPLTPTHPNVSGSCINAQWMFWLWQ